MNPIPGIAAVVTARVKSSRLPEKVLAQIEGKPALEILLSFCRQSGYPIVLAIPKSKEDDCLVEIGRRGGASIYRGEDGSPLHRLAAASKGLKHVVRITADDILIDPTILRNQVEAHVEANADYTFCRRCPDGVAGEVIRVSSLQHVAEARKDPVEFVSYHLRRPGWNVLEYVPPVDFQERLRLTMDWPEDLEVLRILFAELRQPFGALQVINFFRDRRHQYIRRINALPEVTVYTCNHNHGRYLNQAARSVLTGQETVDLEYLYLDDGSTDDSARIILEWYSGLPEPDRRRVKLWRNPERVGLPAMSNRAVAAARGEWILRLDADDMLAPGALGRMLSEAAKSRTIAGVFSAYWESHENESNCTLIGPIQNTARHPGCALLQRRAVNELKFREDLEHYEGVEFFRRFLENYEVADVNEPCWIYRKYPWSKSAQDTEERRTTAKKLGL